MRRIITILLAVLLCAPFVLADFDVDVESVRHRVLVGERAEFSLIVTNNGASTETYKIITPEWSTLVTPIINVNNMVIEPGESVTSNLKITVPGGIAYGQYDVAVRVQSVSSGVSKSENVRIVISSGVESVYNPDIRATISIFNEGGQDGKISPQSPVIVELNLENRNTRNIEDMSVRVKSELMEGRTSFSLGPNEKKTVNVTVDDLDPFIPPQSATVEILFLEEDELFKTIEKEFEFIDVSPDFEEKVSTVDSFLKTVITTSVRNVGNVEKSGTVRVETNLWSRIFTSEDPNPRISKEEGKTYYAWDLELSPGESVDLVTKKSYRLALLLLIIVVLLVVGYQMIKPHVIISKRVINVVKKEEGISEIKVALTVRNISSKMVKNVRVMDVAPKIANYVKEEIAGSMVPSKVRTYELVGTHLEWDISELSGKEERIIRYKVKTKIGIVGEFKLPSAEVRYQSKSGRRLSSVSSKCIVGASEEEE